MSLVTINHDPFSRVELQRESLPAQAGGCKFCGNLNYKGGLFRYLISRDDRPSRPDALRGVFCSIQCMRSYHG